MHQTKGYSKDEKGSLEKEKLCFDTLSIVSVFPAQRYITSHIQSSLKLPSEGNIKALPACNTNHGTQASNSVGDLDTSPLVNWSVVCEGITLTWLTHA